MKKATQSLIEEKASVISRNNVRVIGSGDTTLVFAHGFGCDQTIWRFVAPAFASNCRVVLFDFVGFGNSDVSAFDPDRYCSLEGYAQDVIDVCRSLDLQDCIYVGHSVSGIIGALASIREPERFKRLILIGPSPRYINDLPDYVGGFERDDIEALFDLMDKNFMSWASYLAPIVMGNTDRPELSQELEQRFCSTDPVFARSFAQATFFADNRGDLPKVTTPALIMQCADDFIAPTSVGNYMHCHLRGSELHQMRATGHCPHMSHPEETISVIRDYLERNAA